MTTFKLLGAAAVLSAIVVSSASAQAVVQEPGTGCVLSSERRRARHAGSSRPAVDAQAMAPRPVMRHPAPARQARSAK